MYFKFKREEYFPSQFSGYPYILGLGISLISHLLLCSHFHWQMMLCKHLSVSRYSIADLMHMRSTLLSLKPRYLATAFYCGALLREPALNWRVMIFFCAFFWQLDVLFWIKNFIHQLCSFWNTYLTFSLFLEVCITAIALLSLPILTQALRISIIPVIRGTGHKTEQGRLLFSTGLHSFYY